MRLLYFAWLRERMGRNDEQLALPDGVATVGQLMEFLRARDAAGTHAFVAGGMVRAAVNETFAGPDTPVADGDEVAFFPPVTGG